MQPAKNNLPNDIRATIVRVFAYMGALAIIAIAAASFLRTPEVVAAVAPAPQSAQPDWINVDRPHPAFELQMPEMTAESSDYAILRRNADSARKDVLSFGAADAAGPYAMVEIYRPGAESERFIDAPSEIAARIVNYTVTDDVKAAGSLDSKFGAVPLVDFAIAAGNQSPSQNRSHPPGAARRCLGFARAFEQPTMQISGWYCSAHDEVVDRATLACMLDRLTVLSAGGDPQLDALFAHAEIKRTFCGQRNPILAATPERDRPVPIPRSVRARNGKSESAALRGRISQR